VAIVLKALNPNGASKLVLFEINYGVIVTQFMSRIYLSWRLWRDLRRIVLKSQFSLMEDIQMQGLSGVIISALDAGVLFGRLVGN
jgi:hypothetical protein